MKKAIVTGATGFIGSYVVKELISRDIFVYAVVRKNTKNLRSLPASSKIKIVECDLENIKNLPDMIKDKDIDVFYHFAWQGVSDKDQKDYNVQLKNIEYCLDATENLEAFGVKKFIGAGSISELECIQEMSEQQISNNMGIMYKSAKLAAHYMSKVNVSNKNIDFLWPIITNTYGIGEKSGRLIVSSIKKLLLGESVSFTKAEQNYDFIYITDLAKAFVLLGEKGISCRDYIIGSGQARVLKEYLEYVGKYVNPQAELKFGAHPFRGIYLPIEAFDTTSLVEDTGFEPEVSFEKGIELLTDWIKEEMKMEE